MDFALILVVATAITGLIWLADALFFARARSLRAVRGVSVAEPVVVEYAKSFFPVLLIVLLLRSFLFEPFRIPSGSMMPTLLRGDFIFVNKFSYGLRLPVLNTKILEVGEARRGEVVVFRYPSDTSVNYIKRVVGLPGDLVSYSQATKQLTINGEPVPTEVVGDYPAQPETDLAREVLGAVEHDILLERLRHSRGGDYRVPEGHYFMMGDNRDRSLDSRVLNAVGFVPAVNLIGKAEVRFFSINDNIPPWQIWRWPGNVRLDRMFQSVY